MKIGLFGYGKMGKEIEAIALQKNHTVLLKIDAHNRNVITENNLQQCDVIIDFSTPHSVLENINLALNAEVPIVVGTTGWHTKIEDIATACKAKNGSILYGSNFSVGVNIFFALNKYLANIMDNYESYNPSIHEIHHIQKLDSPSGTAISLGKDILEELSRKNQWVDTNTHLLTDLLITANRIENVSGTHIVSYNSEVDSIEIKHVAHNRKGFALGAVMAAEWIVNKKGMFEVKEMFNF